MLKNAPLLALYFLVSIMIVPKFLYIFTNSDTASYSCSNRNPDLAVDIEHGVNIYTALMDDASILDQGLSSSPPKPNYILNLTTPWEAFDIQQWRLNGNSWEQNVMKLCFVCTNRMNYPLSIIW